jgi:hypothetical protein
VSAGENSCHITTEESPYVEVPTFIAAGHETTRYVTKIASQPITQVFISTATTWALLALTDHVEAQTKLREELLSVSTDMPSMEQLNALPYLDDVVREALRLYAPVSATNRVVLKDDVIPLGEPFTDKNGVVHQELR